MLSITGAFAGVIASSTHDSRKWIVVHDLPPSIFIFTLFGQGQPGLNIFAGGTGMVTRGESTHINWAFSTPAAGMID
jgi:hypothetical protein